MLAFTPLTFLATLLTLSSGAPTPAPFEPRATPLSLLYWTGSSCGSGISNAVTVNCGACTALSNADSALASNVVSGTVTLYSGSGCSGSSKVAGDLQCVSGFSAKSVKYSC